MSYIRTVTLNCDRCTGVVRKGTGDEADWPDGDDPPAIEVKIPNPTAEGGVEVIRFDDLCAPCQKVADNLVARLKSPKKRGKGSKGPQLPLETK